MREEKKWIKYKKEKSFIFKNQTIFSGYFETDDNI